MKLLRLYIKDFMCYEKGYIDFSDFSSALIVGKLDNNDNYSNGVGKSTIFKSIEYVLFNQSDITLERIVRDDTNLCNVVLDFLIENDEYRISRSRTKKGSADLSLFKRTAVPYKDYETNHDKNESPLSDEKYWKDISGRRTADTEKDLSKLVKINFNSFRASVNFMQHDFSGLATSTPEKRKGILKDALNLLIYSKLEKNTKDKFSIISKEIDKSNLLIENIGNPTEELNNLITNAQELEKNLFTKNESLNILNTEFVNYNNSIIELNDTLSKLESTFSSIVVSQQSLINDISKLEISIKEYNSKKTNVIKSAKEITTEIQDLKNEQSKLAQLSFYKIDILTAELDSKKDLMAQNNANIKNFSDKLEELKIPIPADGVCKHCRQKLTMEHREICRANIEFEIKKCQDSISSLKKENFSLNEEVVLVQRSINELNLSKQKIESLTTKISLKNKEVLDKRAIHDEYVALLNKFTLELNNKNEELKEVQEKLKKSPIDEANNIKFKIEEHRNNLLLLNNNISSLSKEILDINNIIAVNKHNIDQKQQDILKKDNIIKSLGDLKKKSELYPIVLQAFSSTGIPNLIIQNVLDDLQIEANKLLAQLKPGLQLSFLIEKTKGDGTEADTLDINYNINGRDRYYKQLSGAQQLAVTFSLKLGLSFLLQKMIGTDLKFLLLDEIDQALDKAGVDAFVDIVKFFQKDFTILVITHNDRLKDKFSHAILVEQDMNLVSKAKVVSSW